MDTDDQSSKSHFTGVVESLRYLLPVEVGCFSVIAQGIWHNIHRGVAFFGNERAVRGFPISLHAGAGVIFIVMICIFGYAEKRVFKLANQRGRGGIAFHFMTTLIGGLLMLGSLYLAGIDRD